MFNGSCLCGDVQFQVEGEFEQFFLCHCEHCQKDTGSAHAATLFSSTAQINWLSGAASIKEFNLPGTRHVKGFCQRCGSALPTVQMNGRLLAVPAGSLDSDVTIRPNAHIFYGSRSNWDHDLNSIEQFQDFPIAE